MRRRVQTPFVAVVLVLGILGAVPAGADPISIDPSNPIGLSLLPSSPTLTLGQEFSVGVFIDNVANLVGYDIELQFSNAGSITFRDADPLLNTDPVGPNFSNELGFLRDAAGPDGTLFFDDPLATDAAGNLNAVHAFGFLLGPEAVASGDGALFEILLTYSGLLPIDITFGSVVLNFANPADVIVNGDARLALNGTTVAPVPEPSSLVLMGVGLAAGYGRRRLRKRPEPTNCSFDRPFS
jgi:hypothetical protein